MIVIWLVATAAVCACFTELYINHTEKNNEQDFWLVIIVLPSLGNQGGKIDIVTTTHQKRFTFSSRGVLPFFSKKLLVLCLKAVPVYNETEGHITLLTLPGGRLSCLVCPQCTQVLRPYEAILLVSASLEIAMGKWPLCALAGGTTTVTPQLGCRLLLMGSSCFSLQSPL